MHSHLPALRTRLGIAGSALSLLLGSGALTLGAVAAQVATAPGAAALGNDLALTPPMGWNSWNKFGCSVTEAKVKAVADAIVSKGLKDLGYTYVTVDDCWMASARDTDGKLVADAVKFPSGMKSLGDYLHGKGLKFGLYESPTEGTCQHRPGSYGHEKADAASFAVWGVDYLKYDWCQTSTTESPTMWADFPGYTEKQLAQVLFPRMRDALADTKRPIVYSLSACCSALDFPSWAGPVANLWRTSTDINDSWSSVLYNFGRAASTPTAAKPGQWNDPDMLEVGNGGMTDAEYRSHFSLWAQLAAPLIMGNDVSAATTATLAILGRSDVIAVDQDSAGKQGTVVSDSGGLLVMSRVLANGDRSVTLTNKNASAATISTSANAVGIGGAATYTLKDLWAGTSTTNTTGVISAQVPSHGTVMYRVTGTGTATSPIVSGGVYEIATGTTQAIDVPNSSTSNGTQLITWAWHAAANQKWTLTANGDGSYQLKNANSGLCADVNGGSTAAGTAIIQYTCHTGDNQKWTPVASGTGYQLVGKASNLALTSASTANGAAVTQENATGTANQTWTFTKVG
ncbi:alpha-galactosidase [Kitasatospora sp. NPDC057015]|uniref:alpha-galactosidase n=1 Tax=Kitasatospora sp. NPDC057015 TaxID=3346001 RepID=UPI003628CBA2